MGSVSVVFGVDPVEGVSSPESPPEGAKAVSSVSNVSPTDSPARALPPKGVSSPESPPEVEAAESIVSVLANEIRRQLRSSSILGGGFVSRLHRMNRFRWRLTYRQGE